MIGATCSPKGGVVRSGFRRLASGKRRISKEDREL